MAAASKPSVTEEFAAIGIESGKVFQTLWHGGSYIGPVEVVSISAVAGEPTLVLREPGMKKFHLIPWRAVERIST
jgi:hypothetical protein